MAGRRLRLAGAGCLTYFAGCGDLTATSNVSTYAMQAFRRHFAKLKSGDQWMHCDELRFHYRNLDFEGIAAWVHSFVTK